MGCHFNLLFVYLERILKTKNYTFDYTLSKTSSFRSLYLSINKAHEKCIEHLFKSFFYIHYIHSRHIEIS